MAVNLTRQLSRHVGRDGLIYTRQIPRDHSVVTRFLTSATSKRNLPLLMCVGGVVVLAGSLGVGQSPQAPYVRINNAKREMFVRPNSAQKMNINNNKNKNKNINIEEEDRRVTSHYASVSGMESLQRQRSKLRRYPLYQAV